jgi:hypothetical protein
MVGSMGWGLCSLIIDFKSESTSGLAGNFATAPPLKAFCPYLDNRKSTNNLEALGFSRLVSQGKSYGALDNSQNSPAPR